MPAPPIPEDVNAVSVARSTALSALSLVLLVASCGRDHQFRPATGDVEPVVFDDSFAPGSTFQAFAGSKFDAISVSTTDAIEGGASIEVTVPSTSASGGNYARGAFTTSFPRDLTSFDALTFYAKASKPQQINECGIGNDNTGTSLYSTTVASLELTTTWQKYILPIPNPAKLVVERGLFWFAENDAEGYTIWFDDIRFERTGAISNPRPVIDGPAGPIESFVGATVKVPGTQTTFEVGGEDLLVLHDPAYFDYSASDDSLAVPAVGGVRILAGGTFEVTGSLRGIPATGSVSYTAEASPTEPAPIPTDDPADVIALFSDAYTDRPVDRWTTEWDNTDYSDFAIAGNPVKVYTNMKTAAIEFTENPVDASTMTHFRMDLWLPAGSFFRVKLVDFGANGVFGGGDDSEHEIVLDASSSPPITTGEWIRIDLPLDSFTRLAAREHLAQLILSVPFSQPAITAYVDNIYFWR